MDFEYVPTEEEGLRYGFLVNATKELGNEMWALATDFAEHKDEAFFIFNEVSEQIAEFKKWLETHKYALGENL